MRQTHHGRPLVKTAKNALRSALIAAPLIALPGLASSLEWTSASGSSDTWYERIAAHMDWREALDTAPASRFHDMGGESAPRLFLLRQDPLSAQVPTVDSIGSSGDTRPLGLGAGARQGMKGAQPGLASSYRYPDSHADGAGYLQIDWESPCLWSNLNCVGQASRQAVAFADQEGNALPEPVALVLIGLAAAAFGLRRRGA